VGPCSPIAFELNFRIRHSYVGIDDNLYECLMGASPNRNLATLKIDEVASGEIIDRQDVFNTWGIPP
jgi:hypothetical protein